MIEKTDRLAEARSLYARTLAAEAGSSDPRLERVFATVPREAFLAPGPWHMLGAAGYVSTPDADPVHLYQNALVAIDAERGINNGEPALHASWISAISPRPGETVCHVGAGTGYYTAMLAMLVLPGGKVLAYEIEEQLADAARRNLAPYENVTVVHGNAVTEALPASDIIYVSAGVVAPPVAWLEGPHRRRAPNLSLAAGAKDRAGCHGHAACVKIRGADRQHGVVHSLCWRIRRAHHAQEARPADRPQIAIHCACRRA